MLVGWDTLEAPTIGTSCSPAYQGGREFDDELVDQLDVLPEFVAACGFANAKAAGYEADDFLAAAVAQEERRGGTAIVASGDRDAFQLASDRTTILHPVRPARWRASARRRCASATASSPEQVPDFIALRGDPSTSCRGARRRPGGGGEPAAEVRHAGGGARRRPLRRRGGGAAPLPPDRDDGREGAAAARSAQKPTWAKAAALRDAWSLNGLAERLDQLARVTRPGEPIAGGQARAVGKFDTARAAASHKRL